MATETEADCIKLGHKIVRDAFAALTGVSRYVQGNCFCLDCNKPVPLLWNGGRIEPLVPAK